MFEAAAASVAWFDAADAAAEGEEALVVGAAEAGAELTLRKDTPVCASTHDPTRQDAR